MKQKIKKTIAKEIRVIIIIGGLIGIIAAASALLKLHYFNNKNEFGSNIPSLPHPPGANPIVALYQVIYDDLVFLKKWHKGRPYYYVRAKYINKPFSIEDEFPVHGEEPYVYISYLSFEQFCHWLASEKFRENLRNYILKEKHPKVPPAELVFSDTFHSDILKHLETVQYVKYSDNKNPEMREDYSNNAPGYLLGQNKKDSILQ